MSRALLLLLVAACHKDGGPGAIDASIADARVDARPVDAGVDAPQYVFAVTCPGGPLPTIRGDDSVEDRYLPESVTIATNDVVMFVMSATHDVVPLPTDSDPCLRS